MMNDLFSICKFLLITLIVCLSYPNHILAQATWVEPATVIYLGVEKIKAPNSESYWIKNKENTKLSCGHDVAMFLSRNTSSGESIIVHGYVRDQNYGVAVQDVVFAINDNNYKNYPKEDSYSKEISGVLKYHPGTPNSGDIPVVYIANGNNNTHLCICKQVLYDNSSCQSHFNISSLLNTLIVAKGEMIKVEDGEDPDKPFECFNASSLAAISQGSPAANPQNTEKINYIANNQNKVNKPKYEVRQQANKPASKDSLETNVKQCKIKGFYPGMTKAEHVASEYKENLLANSFDPNAPFDFRNQTDLYECLSFERFYNNEKKHRAYMRQKDAQLNARAYAEARANNVNLPTMHQWDDLPIEKVRKNYDATCGIAENPLLISYGEIKKLFNANGYKWNQFAEEFANAYHIKMDLYETKNNSGQVVKRKYVYENQNDGCRIVIDDNFNLFLQSIAKKTNAVF